MDLSHQDSSMIVNCKNQSGFTPLHYASENGHFSIVKCLLRYTMDKNPKNEWGTTPLHYAAVEGTGYLNHFVLVTYSNLPNNRVGPFHRVGGRFLRN